MKNGYLSQYFQDISAKLLSEVEVNPKHSNQHEFQGVSALRKMLGTEKRTYMARFLFLDDELEPTTDDVEMTWYDARRNKPNRSPEYRLYYPTSPVIRAAAAGDVLVIARRPDDTLLVVIARSGSTTAAQLVWLFGVEPGKHFTEAPDLDSNRLEYASRYILEQMGVEICVQSTDDLQEMLDRFSGSFPTTRVFSEFARSTLPELDARDDPDGVLLCWLEREEMLFRTLEKHIIQKRLAEGFADVDDFIRYSLSVQNRRKSRVGLALENHFEAVLNQYDIRYNRTKVTENHSKPDFIFPGILEYHDPTFPQTRLTMLGSKSTCKDRWRQILSEADRIPNKHLLTLEAAISKHQTDEMSSRRLQLVIPREIHKTYTLQQQQWLWDVHTLLEVLRKKQEF